MNTAETYDKVYFNDNYKEQFETLRNHYRARTRIALQGRKVDHAPVPNATTVVYLHDDPNGGTHITTGDFVEYFNRRFGGNDRIGAARRSLVDAAHKAENCRDMDKKRAAAVKKREEKAFTPRSAKRRFALVHALFAIMLLLAVGLWGGSTLYLQSTEQYVLEVEERRAMLEIGNGVTEDAVSVTEEAVMSDEITIFMNMGEKDQVEVYPEEEIEMPALLSIFANLGKED